MTKYRLDEYKFLRGGVSRNRQVWLEEIKVADDGEIFYTERYVQISLIELLNYLKR